jgi:hypothetical protein
VYRRELAVGRPKEIPSEVAELARDTLGGAVSAAEQLPEPLRLALINASIAAGTHCLARWIASERSIGRDCIHQPLGIASATCSYKAYRDVLLSDRMKL